MDIFSGEQNFFCNLKVTVSSFFSFLLCGSTFRFPMQIHNHSPLIQTLPFPSSGLQTLISSQQDQHRVLNRTVPAASVIRSNLFTRSSSFSSSSNFLMDDLIGTESGVCLTANTEEIDHKSNTTDSDSDFLCNRNDRCDSTEQKKFPPPIPFLATQAGHRAWPAWILARNYVDGRLVLKLERVRHHESLESHRENGRLVLNLVPTPVAGVDEDDDDDEIDDDRDLQFVEEVEGDESIVFEEVTDPEIALNSFTYGGGMLNWDRKLFCDVKRNFEERHVVHGHFGSAPLRPMGTVM